MKGRLGVCTTGTRTQRILRNAHPWCTVCSCRKYASQHAYQEFLVPVIDDVVLMLMLMLSLLCFSHRVPWFLSRGTSLLFLLMLMLSLSLSCFHICHDCLALVSRYELLVVDDVVIVFVDVVAAVVVFSHQSFVRVLSSSRLVSRYELRPGGADKDVSAAELQQWVDEVSRALLVDSVLEQVEALVKGKRKPLSLFLSLHIISWNRWVSWLA